MSDTAVPNQGSVRKLTPKGAATRTRIIELATEAFVAEGYAATSIRTVAVRAGMTTGAIYAIFGSKSGLLLEAVRESIAHDLEDFPPEILDRPLPDIVAWQHEQRDSPGRQRLRKLLVDAASVATTDVEIRQAIGALVSTRLNDWSDAHREWQESAGVDPTIDMQALTSLSLAIELGTALLEGLTVPVPTAAQSADFIGRLLQSLPTRD